jgi:hypothetical protein
MQLLKVLAMPFQLTSLLFVAGSSLMLGLILGSGNFATVLIGLAWLWISVTWLTSYAFRMIDDAANGVRKAAVADVDMINPFADARCWVHPVLGLALAVALWSRPGIPLAPVLLGVALLFPPSIAASAMSGEALDALNPRAIWRVVRGLGAWYAVMVLATAVCAALGVQIVRLFDPGWLPFAALELLLLVGYACIGGIVHLRRIELGFAPRFSPERTDEKAEQQRVVQRQKVFDEIFEQVRGRHGDRALELARQWLQPLAPHQRHVDLQALLDTGSRWKEEREFGRLLRSLLPVLGRGSSLRSRCWWRTRASRPCPTSRLWRKRRPSHWSTTPCRRAVAALALAWWRITWQHSRRWHRRRRLSRRASPR